MGDRIGCGDRDHQVEEVRREEVAPLFRTDRVARDQRLVGLTKPARVHEHLLGWSAIPTLNASIAWESTAMAIMLPVGQTVNLSPALPVSPNPLAG